MNYQVAPTSNQYPCVLFQLSFQRLYHPKHKSNKNSSFHPKQVLWLNHCEFFSWVCNKNEITTSVSLTVIAKTKTNLIKGIGLKRHVYFFSLVLEFFLCSSISIRWYHTHQHFCIELYYYRDHKFQVWRKLNNLLQLWRGRPSKKTDLLKKYSQRLVCF